MEIQESGRPSPVSRSVLIIGILSGLSCVLLIVILGIVGSTHYRQSEETQSVSSLSSSQLAELLPLDLRFPGYFLTEEEMKERMAYLNASRPATRPKNTSDTCSSNSFEAFPNFTEEASAIPFSLILPAKPIYQVCCNSQTGYTCPSSLVDIDGVNRTLATFGNKKQCFFNETCLQQNGCTQCTCRIIPVLTTGVYVNGNSYGIATFSASGCCKCLNMATS